MKERIFQKSIYFLLLCLMFSTVFAFNVNAKEEIGIPNTVRVWRNSNTSLRLKWSRVKDGDGYIIYKYNEKTKKYKKYKVLKGKNTTKFIDRTGIHKTTRYKISAYKNIKGKNVAGKQSYAVSARTYGKKAKKVNAKKVTLSTTLEDKFKADWAELAYHESINIAAKVIPGTYSKNKRKKVISKKVTWYSTDTSIAKVNKTGMVTAGTKEGVSTIYARAHNGKKSAQFTITVKNYAKPAKDDLELDAAYQNQIAYGSVLEMFVNYYQAVTNIAEYFNVNRPKEDEVFSCWMEDGEVKMQPETYVTGNIKQIIYDFVKDFPYEVRVLVYSNRILFRSKIEDRWYATVAYLYDKTSKDEGPYEELHVLAPQWTYGEFDYSY